MKRAILIMTPEFVQDMMQLPDGCIITRIDNPIDRPGTLEVCVEGAGWEVKPGELIPRVIGTISLSEDGAKDIDWGFDRNVFFTGIMK